jgi:hypothetical protein
MRHYKFLVFTKPIDGREQEYDDWYQNIHLQDLVAVPGFKSAQRFRLKKTYQKPLRGDEPFDHLAIYDIETDDLDGVLAGMKRLSGKVVISDALDLPASSALFYEEYGAVVSSPGS